MYQKTGKPSVAKFRSRLERIRECSESGRVLAEHWNPKGRNAQIQREMILFFKESEKISVMFLDTLKGRRT